MRSVGFRIRGWRLLDLYVLLFDCEEACPLDDKPKIILSTNVGRLKKSYLNVQDKYILQQEGMRSRTIPMRKSVQA